MSSDKHWPSSQVSLFMENTEQAAGLVLLYLGWDEID